MQKRDALLLRTNPRHFVDEANTSGPAARQRSVEVVDGEADVMNPRAAFGHEPADRRFRGFRFEQLDERFSGRHAGDARPIGVVEGHVRQTEDVAVKRQDLIEGPHRNSDVRKTGPASG